LKRKKTRWRNIKLLRISTIPLESRREREKEKEQNRNRGKIRRIAVQLPNSSLNSPLASTVSIASQTSPPRRLACSSSSSSSSSAFLCLYCSAK
jgi:hypothetical protein